MKAASGPLLTLLNSGLDFEQADLWTITLSGGVVVRWSGADIALVSSGQTFALGPLISRGDISQRIGIDVDQLQVTLQADSSDLINGTPLIPFIRKRGLDGAIVKLERAFLPNWNSSVTGTINHFAGRVTAIDEISGNLVQFTVSSWSVLLDQSMPTNLYQVGCLHSLYDAGCGLSAAAFASTGTVTGTPTAQLFNTTLTPPANDFAQGRIVFTSGANAGISATVKSNTGGGQILLIRNLPNVPAAGDAFTIYPGCDYTQARCTGRFNNLPHHKATPFVPVPETSFG